MFTAHNAEFDAAFIAPGGRGAGVALPLDRRLCTLQLSRRLDPDRQLTHGLADVCARYGVATRRAPTTRSPTPAPRPPCSPTSSAPTACIDEADLDPLYSP